MSIPAGYVVTRRTPVFTHHTAPPALLGAHETKAGTWAMIHVLEGKLRYRIESPAVGEHPGARPTRRDRAGGPAPRGADRTGTLLPGVPPRSVAALAESRSETLSKGDNRMSEQGSDPSEPHCCVSGRCPDGTTRGVPGRTVRRWNQRRPRTGFRCPATTPPSWARCTSASSRWRI